MTIPWWAGRPERWPRFIAWWLYRWYLTKRWIVQHTCPHWWLDIGRCVHCGKERSNGTDRSC